MFANRILDIIVTIIAIPLILLQLITTLVLGILVHLSFGILLIPLSLVWFLLLGPMLGLSWLCHKMPVFRNIIGILLIPWVVIADIYVSLIPSMGDLEGRVSKLLLCQTWPFTWEFWVFSGGRKNINSPNGGQLQMIIKRVARKNPLMQAVVNRIIQCNYTQEKMAFDWT